MKRFKWALFGFLLIALNFEDGVTRPMKCGEDVLKAYFLKGTSHNGYTAGKNLNLPLTQTLQMTSKTFVKLWTVVKNTSPLIDLLQSTTKCLLNTLITFQSKYDLRNRVTSGRLHFSPSRAGNTQIGFLKTDFTRLYGAATPPFTSNHEPDDDIIPDCHNRYLNDWIKVKFIELKSIYLYM